MTVIARRQRFIGILIEHFAGAFPTWLSPVQVKLLTVTGTLANPPTPTLEGGAQPAEPWEFKWRGKTLCCRNKRGLVFIVR